MFIRYLSSALSNLSYFDEYIVMVRSVHRLHTWAHDDVIDLLVGFADKVQMFRRELQEEENLSRNIYAKKKPPR